MTNKLPDWQNRLVAFVRERHRLPFTATDNHCGLFAGNAYRAMTGKDTLLHGLRSATSIADMVALLKEKGYKGPVDWVASKLEEVDPGQASPGDLAVLPGEGGVAFGIIQGETVYAMNDQGVVIVPRDAVTKAFKV